MKVMNILYGFDETKFQRTIEKILTGFGYEVHYECRYSKASVAEFLKSHKEYTHVVLKENFNRSKYSAEELAELTDERDLNVIVVLSKAHKGTNYMETLYAANILGALFMEGNESDATVDKVADLLMHGRKREHARKYYGMGDKLPTRVNHISDGKLSDLLQALDDISYGDNPGKRFAQLCTSLTVKQTVEFLQKIPIDLRTELEKYDDFWMVITALSANGVDIKSRKYATGIKNYSKRQRINAAQDKTRIEDKKLDEEYVPKGKVYQSSNYSKQEEETPVEEEELFGTDSLTDEPTFAEKQPREVDVTPTRTQAQELPPTNDWRELKRREKEQKKQAKRDAKANKYRKLERQTPPQQQNARPANNPKQGLSSKHEQSFESYKPYTNEKVKVKKDETKKKEAVIRLGIVLAVILFIGLLVTVVVGVNYLTKTNAIEESAEQELLTEQMKDLAEIRSGEPIDLNNVVPLSSMVVNGEQIMGINVMDIINSDIQIFYVVNLDGSLYTFENGGATSNEIDVNSMYYSKMLSSGRFAFIQQ